MALSYEYSIGSVRAKETKLLSKQDIDRLTACQTVTELYNALSDKGFSGDSIDRMLDGLTADLWSYIEAVSPDITKFDLLLCRNDLHNIKVAVKGVLSGRRYSHLFMEPCIVSTDLMVSAVEQKRFDKLPDWMADSTSKCFDIIAHQSDARMGDAVIDRAATEHILTLAEGCTETIKKYFNAVAFYSNVKIALRSARTGADNLYLSKALCPIEGMDIQKVIKSAINSESELCDYLKKLDSFGCSGSIEAYQKSPSDFEKYVDDYLMQVAIACRYIGEGMDPLFGYIIAVEAEIKIIHMIKSGIATGRPQQIIRERLRRIYG